jgi:hypothetical protein
MFAMHRNMPFIDSEKLAAILSPEDMKVAKQAIVSRGQNKGRLKASSPKQPYKLPKGKRNDQGVAYYAWRIAALLVSPRGEHHCIPFSADFYLDGDSEGYDRDRVKAERARGDKIAEALVSCVPLEDHHGTKRWSRALYGV